MILLYTNVLSEAMRVEPAESRSPVRPRIDDFSLATLNTRDFRGIDLPPLEPR